MADYDFQRIEAVWQRRWEQESAFEAEEIPGREEFYCLEMLPYPSGKLHSGHVRNYSIGDAIAHFHRLQGRNVLHPIGWDALGLPAENAAIEKGVDPVEWTRSNVAEMRRQLRRLGISYAWSREVDTSRPEFYRWNQWFFLRMLEKDLVYRSRRILNWCPRCNTVLANEQVESGRCWRHDDTEVEQREMDQWFVRITHYAEELDACLDRMPGWPDAVRTMQRNWIGRSEGAKVRFAVEGTDLSIEVFTTRIDTIYGATFLVLAPGHPLLERIAAGAGNETAVARFVEQCREEALRDRFGIEREKRGVPTGRYAVNPFNGRRIPVWTANYVLMEYGSGAIMAVPGHDERDHEFARRHGLPIVRVIAPSEGDADDTALPYTAGDEGRLVASGPFEGLSPGEACRRMAEHARDGGFGEAAVTYRLRDWGISRQRYWGTPIPIVHCDGCGIVPVPDDQLPVLLPTGLDLRGLTGSPLAQVEAFVRTTCPACGGPARRETDTMDTFVDSSWYFYRYTDPENGSAPFDAAAAAYWFPIDHYIGGIAHATGHLIYCRFFHKMMRDLGLTRGEEPVTNLLTQGMVISYSSYCPEHRYIGPEEARVVTDERGMPLRWLCPHDGRELVRTLEKMSKSKNNAPDLDRMIDLYGADTVRLYLLFAAPPEAEFIWSEQGIEGCSRFLARIWRFLERHRGAIAGAGPPPAPGPGPGEADDAIELRRKTHQTISRVTEDLGRRLQFNTAIAAMMELVNAVYGHYDADPLPARAAAAVREAFTTLATLLVPFAPHLAEEIHEALGLEGLAVRSRWPAADTTLLSRDEVLIVVQVDGKLRGRISVPRGAPEQAALEAARHDERVRAAIGGRNPTRTVFVPDRLLNIVTG